MAEAITEAEQGLGLCSPNPAVGAVLVWQDQALARGYHAKAGGPHAEIAAIRSALESGHGEQLTEATLYVTLEPCSTQGRTPACTSAILEHRIPRVVVGCVDPNPRHAGAGLDLLREAGIEVRSGVLEDRCCDLIRYFATHQLRGRPYVVAKSALTLDGRTALAPGEGPWLSSEASREDVQRLRAQLDGILIGGETLRCDNPRLTLRGPWAELDRPQPWRIVVSESGNLPEEAGLFSGPDAARTLSFVKQPLEAVMVALAERDITSLLLESGGRLLQAMLEKGLVDELVFYVAPRFGGAAQLALSETVPSLAVRELESCSIGPDIRLQARVSKPWQVE